MSEDKTDNKEKEVATDAAEETAVKESEEVKQEEVTEQDAGQGAPIEDEEKVAEQEEQAKQQAEEESLPAEEAGIPDLRPGMTVRIHQKIKEGEKERVQVFQGIILALRGKNAVEKTVTVRKTSFGIGVEKIFPLGSPLIEKIEVVKKAKVRRSKLFFLREYKKRLKETLVKDQ